MLGRQGRNGRVCVVCGDSICEFIHSANCHIYLSLERRFFFIGKREKIMGKEIKMEL
jgi:hypothetical protein